MLFNTFTSGKLNRINRFVRSATAERMSSKSLPGESMQRLYRRLAEGEIGLIITGHSFVHPSGRTSDTMTGIHSDEMIEPLSEVVQAAHDAKTGSKIFIQLNHGGRQVREDASGEQAWGPSAEPYSKSTSQHP